ncbi:uncharacterized protein LOC131251060 [Magnolia sinica]|uniref:uncharacterized protein LOC131251060 n=1 Tax=Magnolia sinica TaxID=86752 RepID=UPI00265B4483|nr:uncharacterized protein LOC131251060 [Magnolia sinica]
MELKIAPESDSRVRVSEEEKKKNGRKNSRVSASNSVSGEGDEDDEDLPISALRRISKREKSSVVSEDFTVPAPTGDDTDDLPLSAFRRISLRERSSVDAKDLRVPGRKSDVRVGVSEKKGGEGTSGASNLASRCDHGDVGHLRSSDAPRAGKLEEETSNEEDFGIFESNGRIDGSGDESGNECDNLMISSLFRIKGKGFGDLKKKNDSRVPGKKGDPRISDKEKNCQSFEEDVRENGTGFNADKDSCSFEEENDFRVSKEVGSGDFGFRRFGIGDMVWAKAFPHTWWPGRILRKVGCRALVSFFGGEKSGLFLESEVRGFEENYLALSRMAGGKLLDVIGCALEELGRRADLELTCPCESRMEDMESERLIDVGDHSSEFVEAKKGFQPVKMLGFVLKMAVCAQVKSAEAVSKARAAGQLNAFRRYVSIRPDWMYYETMRISGSSAVMDDSQGTDLETLSHASSENEMPYYVFQDAEDNVQVDEQEDEPEVFSWREKRGLEICMTNSQNFSLFSPNEEFKPLEDDQVDDVDDSSLSLEEDSSIKEVHMEQNSAAAFASQQLDTEEMSDSSVRCPRAAHVNADLGTEFDVNSVSVLAGDITCARKEIENLCGNDSMLYSSSYTDSESPSTTVLESEKEIHQDDMTIAGREYKVDNSLTKRVYSSREKQNDAYTAVGVHEPDTCLPKIRSEIVQQLPTYPSTESLIYASDESEVQSLHEMLKHIHCLALDPFYKGAGGLKSVTQNVLKYRRLVYQNVPNLASLKYIPNHGHNLRVKEICGADPLLCPTMETTKVQPACKVGVASDLTSQDQLSLHVSDGGTEIHLSDIVGAAANVIEDESDDKKVICSSSCHMNSSKDSSSGKRRLDEPVVSGLPFKLRKTQPTPSVHEYGACSLVTEPKSLPSTAQSDPAHEGTMQSLHDMLRHLYCLALDPFYSRKENVKSIWWKILKYRTLVSQNVCDLASSRHTSDGGHALKTSKLPELSGHGSSLHLSTSAAKSCPDDEISVANDGNNEAQLFPDAGDDINMTHCGDKVGVAFESDTNEVDCSLSCPLDRSGDSILGKRRVDEPDASGLSFKLLKTWPFSSACESETCSLKPRSEIEQSTPVDFSIEPQLSLGTCTYPADESISLSVREMLRHLRCLALDPFYSGEQDLKSVQAKFLNYKTLVYQNISNPASLKYTSNGGHAPEATKAQQEKSGLKPLLRSSNGVAKLHPDDKVGLADDVIIEAKLASHVGDDSTKKPSDKADFPVHTLDVERDRRGVSCSRSDLQEPSALRKLDLSNKGDEASSSDKVCIEIEATKNAHLLSQISEDSKKISAEVRALGPPPEHSKDDLYGKSRHNQHVNSNHSFKSPLTRLYASPLLKDGLNSPSGAHQTLKAERDPGGPMCLHMKFPKDFSLPSREELVKKFIAFGPLDVSSTRVFFYTGSGQVVFLHQRDAEAACRYARKKNLFGRANVRFWLGHQNAKSGNGNGVHPSPLLTAGQTALNLKSCLKTTDVHGKKDQRQPVSVKFLTGNQDSSLSETIATKNRLVTLSGLPCDCSSQIGPDISLQMLFLLEKCDQMVCKIRNSLGLESYYSIFSHGYSYIPDMANES